MNASTVRDAQLESEVDASLNRALASIVGANFVRSGFAERLAYARDRTPFATFHFRAGKLPGTMPRSIVMPGSHDEVARVVALAQARNVPVIPFGAGSGVLGGALPLGHEVMIDLKRLNRLVEINETDGTATVEAGLNGGQFEAALNARGFTCGHLPQSLHMSTVGGWASCRGAGQNSTRYGKIEDIVLGLRMVLPDGRTLDVRPVARRAVGPSIRDLFVGAEGTFGIITQLTFRIWRKPEREIGTVLAFPTLEAALTSARQIMQAELRPAVVRVYDAEESRSRTEGMKEFQDRPILGILVFSGSARLASVESELALEIARKNGAVLASDEPLLHWQKNRFVSYSMPWQTKNYYMDTIEVTGAWSQILAMYQRMGEAARAVHPGIHFGAHWSHVYAEGACQYMTVRLPPMDDDKALFLHAQAWDRISRICLELGGSISHHHGVGAFRNPWIGAELNTGLDVLQALKDVIDPNNIMNPGKLALRPRPGAVTLERKG